MELGILSGLRPSRWRRLLHPQRLAAWREMHRRGQLGRYLVARLLAATGLSRLFRIRRRDFVLRFYPSSMSIALWTDPAGRLDDEDFLRGYLRGGDTVVDVGANIGSLTLQAARCVGPGGRVIAVEPHPRTFGYLLGNLKLNGVANVEPFNVALGDTEGVVTLSSDRQDDQNAVVAGGSDLSVRVCPLDALVPPTAHVALLKIDVEGYERFVLAGANETLARTDCIYFESFETAFARFGYSTSDLLRALAVAGFQTFRLDERGVMTPLPLTYRSTTCENLLAARDVAKIRARLGHGGLADEGQPARPRA